MVKNKILVIEDDITVLNSIVDALNATDLYEVKSCANGEEGLNLITAFAPKLVILDIMLPEIDGFEICKNIQSMPYEKKPQIILLTALSNILSKMESNWIDKTGALALLPKPLDVDQMLLQVREVFNR